MSSYSYVAVDPRGVETRGMLEVSDQNEAVRRVKEMGLFPTRILQERPSAKESPGSPTGRRHSLIASVAHCGLGTGVSDLVRRVTIRAHGTP